MVLLMSMVLLQPLRLQDPNNLTVGRLGKPDDFPSDAQRPKYGFGRGSENLSLLLHIVASCMMEGSLLKVARRRRDVKIRTSRDALTSDPLFLQEANEGK
jgi:hypothetical protein